MAGKNSIAIGEKERPDFTRAREDLLRVQEQFLRSAWSARKLGKFCLFVAAYFAGYRYAMSFSQQIAAPFWFPDAVLLSALLLTPPKRWWVYLVVALPIRLVAGVSPSIPGWFLATSYLNDSLRALFSALALRYFLKRPARFSTVRDLLVFILFAVALLPMLSALLGAWSRQALGFSFWPAWRQWFLGDALANLVLTPAILYWVLGGYAAVRTAPWRRRLEGIAVGLGLIGSGLLAFGPWLNAAYQLPARLYFPVPFLAWSAIRFGLRGASAGLALTAVLAILGAVRGEGPFSSLDHQLNVLSIQLFLFVAGMPTLLLAALSSERRQVLLSLGRASDALRESEARFRGVADTAPVFIWMSDTNRRCTFFNKGWLDFTGRTLEQESGNGWAEGVHPEDRPHCLALSEEAFAAGEGFTMEYRLRRKDGEYRWVLDTAAPRFDASGVFVGYIGSCLDIADRKQVEMDHQLQSMELARVGRVALMGELTASLAHEVNNPLGAMVTNASAGQRMIARGQLSTEELQELLADIVSDGHRAREVIEGIRNMVRKSEASRALVSIKEVIHDLLRIVRADAMARQVNLVAEIDANAGSVVGDRVQLLQVLLNLTMNAFEALSAVRADSRRVVLRAECVNEGSICVRLSDSGPGIPAGIAEQLFEPFFSTKAEGTGMGLAIARTITEAHDGTLFAKSDDGGATFIVCLPAATAVESKAA